MMFLGPLVLLVHLLRPVVTSSPSAVVNISTGRIRGQISTTINSIKYVAFQGIPYAEPPVGDLRFKPPVPIKPWTGIKLATRETLVCPQIGPERKVVGSENCLFLNVFTPVTNLSAITEKLKPVMVWIHEGTFTDGSGNTDNRRPDFLLERDVVFVSMNYRLGALGFLSLDHPDATGNQGLKDQNLALKWVQENIEQFGGDPKMVTIFGKSAGAASVGFHVLSKASEGLFHRAISMSGSPLSPLSFISREKAVQRGIKLAKLIHGSSLHLDTTKSLLKKLRAAPIRKLLVESLSIDLTAPFVPTLEKSTTSANVFLTKCAFDRYQHGEINRVPQLLGYVERETVQYAHHTAGFVRLIEKAHKFMSSMGGSEVVPGTLDVLEKVAKELKHRNAIDPVVLTGQEKIAASIATDMLLKLPITVMQKHLVEANKKMGVYYYTITDDVEDLPYIFYIPSRDYDLSSDSPTGAMIDRISTMWTNFAKYGNPTPDGRDEGPKNIIWPKSNDLGPAVEIGLRVRVIPMLISNLADIMQGYCLEVLYKLADC